MKKLFIILMVFLFFAPKVNAQAIPVTEPTVELIYGNPDAQISLYLVAQGYTNDTMYEFDTFATTFKNTFIGTSPFNEFPDDFKIYTVKEIASVNQFPRGINQFNPPYLCGKATAQDATPSETYLQYRARMDNLVANYLPNFNQKSYLMAVFNNDYYTGGGGKYPFVTDYCNGNNVFMSNTLIHEFGHTFGLLGDEYPGSGAAGADSSFYTLFHDRNITQKTVREEIPWNYLINSSTCVPTCTVPTNPLMCSNNTECSSTAIGTFEGANYANAGWYRPIKVNACKMYTQSSNFCLVCKDLLREMIKKHICYSDITVTENFISRHQNNIHWRKASNSLESSSKIGNKITASFVSQNAIQLSDGFTAFPGSTFSGYIGDCSTLDVVNNYKLDSSQEYFDVIPLPSEFAKPDNSITTGINIIPNPANNFIELIMSNATFNKVQIISIDGKSILDKSIENVGNYNLDISGLNSGIYIVKVISSKGEIFSQKLIKN